MRRISDAWGVQIKGLHVRDNACVQEGGLFCRVRDFEIIDWRKPPSQGLAEKAVIAQVIVGIVDAHVEDHTHPQLGQIRGRARAFCLKRVRNVRITCVVTVPCLEQTHGREKGNASFSFAIQYAIKAAYKQHMFASYAQKSDMWRPDACQTGKAKGHIFPEGDVAAVIAARELGNQELSLVPKD